MTGTGVAVASSLVAVMEERGLWLGEEEELRASIYRPEESTRINPTDRTAVVKGSASDG